MKKIEAIIKPFRLEDVKFALAEAGVRGMTVTSVKGFGNQKGLTEICRGSEYNFGFIPKVKLELVVETQDVDRLLAIIMKAARTGKIGDGKLFVSNIEQSLYVRPRDAVEDVDFA